MADKYQTYPPCKKCNSTNVFTCKEGWECGNCGAEGEYKKSKEKSFILTNNDITRISIFMHDRCTSYANNPKHFGYMVTRKAIRKLIKDVAKEI